MKDEEVRGGEQKVSFNDFLTKLKKKMLPVVGVPVFVQDNPSSQTALMFGLSLSLSLSQVCGALSSLSPQSLELDTGVNHYLLDLLITARLRTRSSAAAFRLPTPPSPHYTFTFHQFNASNKSINFSRLTSLDYWPQTFQQ